MNLFKNKQLDYFQNPKIKEDLIVNDVTQLNPVKVSNVTCPQTIEEIQLLLDSTDLDISLGGGRFSMGGQTTSEDSHHLDLREFNKILWLDADNKKIRVQSGARWSDIQKFIDPHNLSIKIMQTYANFTVGGALSVNCHGRYVGLGPIILSVREILLITTEGTFTCSPTKNKDLFFGSIGCYGALGVIAEVELDLVDNIAINRSSELIAVKDYHMFFQNKIKSNPNSIFHNGILYPPHYNTINSITWNKIENETMQTFVRLKPSKKHHLIEQYAAWLVSESLLKRFYRRHIIDALFFTQPKKHLRNFEAGHDLVELEPNSRKNKTYVLQEYFIPVKNFDTFIPKMKNIFNKNKVNIVNVSIRHAEKDTGSLLSWANEEVYAFVIYYKQKTNTSSKIEVSKWTMELIDAALSEGGTYYLPYQPHATYNQFIKAFPRAKELFELKSLMDPLFIFKNSLWNKYYIEYLKFKKEDKSI